MPERNLGMGDGTNLFIKLPRLGNKKKSSEIFKISCHCLDRQCITVLA